MFQMSVDPAQNVEISEHFTGFQPSVESMQVLSRKEQSSSLDAQYVRTHGPKRDNIINNRLFHFHPSLQGKRDSVTSLTSSQTVSTQPNNAH